MTARGTAVLIAVLIACGCGPKAAPAVAAGPPPPTDLQKRTWILQLEDERVARGPAAGQDLLVMLTDQGAHIVEAVPALESMLATEPEPEVRQMAAFALGLIGSQSAAPALITALARRYGSQAVVIAIDATWEGDHFEVYVKSGSTPTGRDAVAWAREAADRGAGEVLLTSIDKDGTRSGFDLPMTAAVSSAVSIPVIASGGAGTFEHFTDVFTTGRADAALAASIFHFSEHAVADLKRHLDAAGIPVRLTT